MPSPGMVASSRTDDLARANERARPHCAEIISPQYWEAAYCGGGDGNIMQGQVHGQFVDC